jgi:hypothetical protein
MQQAILDINKRVLSHLTEHNADLAAGFALVTELTADCLAQNEMLAAQRDQALQAAARLEGQRDEARRAPAWIAFKDLHPCSTPLCVNEVIVGLIVPDWLSGHIAGDVCFTCFVNAVESYVASLQNEVANACDKGNALYLELEGIKRSRFFLQGTFTPPARGPFKWQSDENPVDIALGQVFDCNPCILIGKLTCENCSRHANEVVCITAEAHIKALCIDCGSFLKIVSPNEIIAFQDERIADFIVPRQAQAVEQPAAPQEGDNPLFPPTSDNYPQRIEKAVEMYQANASKTAIFDATSIFHAQLNKVLRERDIPLKSERASEEAQASFASAAAAVEEEEANIQEWESRIPQSPPPVDAPIVIEEHLPEALPEEAVNSTIEKLLGCARLPVVKTTLPVETILGIAQGCIEKLTAPAIAVKTGQRVQELSRYWMPWAQRVANSYHCLSRDVAKEAFMKGLRARIEKQLEAMA